MLQWILPTPALLRTAVWCVLLAAYSVLAVLKEQGQYANYADLPPGLEAAMSLVIGLLLAFRINRAFDRWWEGRTLWGQLVNALRNLAAKANTLTPRDDPARDRLTELLVAFPQELRNHLRMMPPEADQIAGLPATGVKHRCGWIANQVYGICENWKRSGIIQYGEFLMLDREAKVMLEVCGGCERIKNTPIAASFRVLLHHLIALFLLTLPWGLATDFGWLTPAIMFLTSYCVIAAEDIAERVEHPFQVGSDRLELDPICATIETTVREIMATPTTAELESPPT